MKIKNLRLRSFRNLKDVSVVFSPGLNIILGSNGQGKTNLLEAVYYLSTTKSHRNVDDQQLITSGEEFATLDCKALYQQHEVAYSAVIHRKGKTLCINQQPLRKVSEFVGKINAVIFSPLDMNLFDSSPGTRRRLLDIELGKMSTLYITFLNQYSQLLKNRNNYLKQGINDLNLLEAINQQMITPQLEVIKQRNYLVNRFNEEITPLYRQLSKTDSTVKIDYLSVIPYNADEQEMSNQLVAKQKSYEERDILTKQTNFGIHREDLAFWLDNQLVENYASQGQKRMIIIALKLALLKIIREKTDETPILLLDDVLSELDLNHRNALIQLLPEEVQTIITATDKNNIEPELLEKAQLLKIEKGCVSTWTK